MIRNAVDDYKVFEKEFDCPTLQSSRSNIYPNGSGSLALRRREADGLTSLGRVRERRRELDHPGAAGGNR
eukprot:754826-Hanusia_phi.AAC.4